MKYVIDTNDGGEPAQAKAEVEREHILQDRRVRRQAVDQLAGARVVEEANL